MKRQTSAETVLLKIGTEIGSQRMLDMFTIVLNDPEIMGKDVFGRKRLEKVLASVLELDKKFDKAYLRDVEADYYQEKLDCRLRHVWQGDLVPFAERYPYIRQHTYGPRRRR